MPPNISLRTSIAWPPSPPNEPTSTLVLTSPQNRYVDIRIHHAPPNQTKEDGPILPISRLQWAFAGTSTSSPLPDGRGVHSTWTHWVDSKTSIEKVHEVVDEGDCYPLAEGGTVERGEMVNEESGRVQAYEEVWREGEVSGERVCVVVVLDEGARGRGMVVRVGDVCQGVLRVEGGEGEGAVSVERWEVGGDGKWKRNVRIGDFWLPCGVAMECEKVGVGSEVVMGEMKWRVVELSRF